jgi:hypothetical protein
MSWNSIVSEIPPSGFGGGFGHPWAPWGGQLPPKWLRGVAVIFFFLEKIIFNIFNSL